MDRGIDVDYYLDVVRIKRVGHRVGGGMLVRRMRM